jgi:hypothetical protein
MMSIDNTDLQLQIRDIMDEEDPYAAAKHAVSMHKYANRRSGIWGQVILVTVIASAFYFKSAWPLAIGFLAYISIHIYLMYSCIKFVEKTTGLSSDDQAQFSRLYKSNADPDFTKSVDEHYKGSLEAAKQLKETVRY